MANLDGFIAGWLSHRNALIELVGTFEDQHLNYKPWDNGMSVTELVLHITGATGMFVQTVKNGVFTPPAAPKPAGSVKELKEIVLAETEQTKADLESLTEEQLGQMVEFYGMNMPGITLLESGKDHEIHHKGQLFTYARLVGIEKLPFFVSR